MKEPGPHSPHWLQHIFLLAFCIRTMRIITWSMNYAEKNVLRCSWVTTEWMEWMSHRKQKETKQHPGTAGPGNILGCCLVYLRFLYDIHSIYPVYAGDCGEPGPVSHFADIAHSFYQLSALLRPQNWVCAFFNFCALPIPSIPLPWPAAAPMGWH